MVETFPEFVLRTILWLFIFAVIPTFVGAFLIRLLCKLFLKFTPRYWKCFQASFLAIMVINVICFSIEVVADTPIRSMAEYETRRKVVTTITTIMAIFVSGWIIGFMVKKPDSSSLGFRCGIAVTLLNFLISFAIVFIFGEFLDLLFY